MGVEWNIYAICREREGGCRKERDGGLCTHNIQRERERRIKPNPAKASPKPLWLVALIDRVAEKANRTHKKARVRLAFCGRIKGRGKNSELISDSLVLAVLLLLLFGVGVRES